MRDTNAAASPALRARLQWAADSLADTEWREHDLWWDEDEEGDWNDDPCPPLLSFFLGWWRGTPATPGYFTPGTSDFVGFSVGIFGGGAWGQSRFNFSDGTTGNFSTSGGLVGLSGGVDWMTGPLVTGVEGTISWAKYHRPQ